MGRGSNTAEQILYGKSGPRNLNRASGEYQKDPTYWLLIPNTNSLILTVNEQLLGYLRETNTKAYKKFSAHRTKHVKMIVLGVENSMEVEIINQGAASGQPDDREVGVKVLSQNGGMRLDHGWLLTGEIYLPAEYCQLTAVHSSVVKLRDK